MCMCVCVSISIVSQNTSNPYIWIGIIYITCGLSVVLPLIFSLFGGITRNYYNTFICVGGGIINNNNNNNIIDINKPSKWSFLRYNFIHLCISIFIIILSIFLSIYLLSSRTTTNILTGNFLWTTPLSLLLGCVIVGVLPLMSQIFCAYTSNSTIRALQSSTHTYNGVIAHLTALRGGAITVVLFLILLYSSIGILNATFNSTSMCVLCLGGCVCVCIRSCLGCTEGCMFLVKKIVTYTTSDTETLIKAHTCGLISYTHGIYTRLIFIIELILICCSYIELCDEYYTIEHIIDNSNNNSVVLPLRLIHNITCISSIIGIGQFVIVCVCVCIFQKYILKRIYRLFKNAHTQDRCMDRFRETEIDLAYISLREVALPCIFVIFISGWVVILCFAIGSGGANMTALIATGATNGVCVCVCVCVYT
eukprot:GHVR01190815.1.p1 GENE.GHVR01190815.1~~GHVR01190815.1.p1  ORF type:complete len:438 (-),score=113.56 GHVR01190815.1:48-1313(-)